MIKFVFMVIWELFCFLSHLWIYFIVIVHVWTPWKSFPEKILAHTVVCVMDMFFSGFGFQWSYLLLAACCRIFWNLGAFVNLGCIVSFGILFIVVDCILYGCCMCLSCICGSVFLYVIYLSCLCQCTEFDNIYTEFDLDISAGVTSQAESAYSLRSTWLYYSLSDFQWEIVWDVIFNWTYPR